MKLENAEIGQWKQKCNSDGNSAVELTIRADIVKNGYPNTFCNPDVRRDFETYISKYEFGDGLNRERCNTELIEENEKLKEKVKELELIIGCERRISEKLRDDVNSLCDGQVELQNDLRKSEIERAKLEKDLMEVADILQVTGLRTITDILAKAHYWVHERSVDDEELKMILKMDLDAGREEILYRIEEVVSDASECEDARLALMNVYNACLPSVRKIVEDEGNATDISKAIVRVITNNEKLRRENVIILADFITFRDKVKKIVGCESTEFSEILDILKRRLEEKKELSGKLEMFCRFRDDVKATFGIRDCDEDESDILYELYRAALLAEKTEFICGYFDVKQIPLTSLAENLCLEIKEKVVSEYKKEVESKRQDAVLAAAKKAGSVGNGVYLDGLSVEQNLRAENVRLKTECDGYKKDIEELKNSLDCIYNETSAALGYE